MAIGIFLVLVLIALRSLSEFLHFDFILIRQDKVAHFIDYFKHFSAPVLDFVPVNLAFIHLFHSLSKLKLQIKIVEPQCQLWQVVLHLRNVVVILLDLLFQF